MATANAMTVPTIGVILKPRCLIQLKLPDPDLAMMA